MVSPQYLCMDVDSTFSCNFCPILLNVAVGSLANSFGTYSSIYSFSSCVNRFLPAENGVASTGGVGDGDREVARRSNDDTGATRLLGADLLGVDLLVVALLVVALLGVDLLGVFFDDDCFGTTGGSLEEVALGRGGDFLTGALCRTGVGSSMVGRPLFFSFGADASLTEKSSECMSLHCAKHVFIQSTETAGLPRKVQVARFWV